MSSTKSPSTEKPTAESTHHTLMFGFILTHPAFVHPEFHSLLSLTQHMHKNVCSIQDFSESTQHYDPIRATSERQEQRIPEIVPNADPERHKPSTLHWADSTIAECSNLRTHYPDTRFGQDSATAEPPKFAFLTYPTQHHSAIHTEVNDIYLKRSVLLEAVFQFYKGYEDLKWDLRQNLMHLVRGNAPQQGEGAPTGMRFRLDVTSTHKKLSLDDVLSYRAKYIDWVFEGVRQVAEECQIDHVTPVVSIKDPQVVFTLNVLHVKRTEELVGEYFGRRIGESNRKPLLKRYALNKRDYIGTTSMTALLSFLCANQAKVVDSNLVLDPFVGTGSLLVACAHLGCYVLGNDLDYKTLQGRKGKNLHSNFKQYGLDKLVMFDVFRSCLSQQSLWHTKELFDAIVTDPPYGKRESASKIGRIKPLKAAMIEEGHIPSRIQYDREELMEDFLHLCAMLLKVGGRLVYWLISDVVFRVEDDLPTHPCFELVCISEDRLSTKSSRRLITMKKIKSYEDGLREKAQMSTTGDDASEKRLRSPSSPDDTRERKKAKMDTTKG